MSVLQHDNLLRFRVRSRTDCETEHVVDVSAYGGIGSCSCPHFDFRLRPAIEQGTSSPNAPIRCAHIVAAREAFTNGMIARLSDKADKLEAEDKANFKPGIIDKANSQPPSEPRRWHCPDCLWRATATTAPAAREAINRNPGFAKHCTHLAIEEVKADQP